MSLIDTLIGGGLAAGGGALITWWEIRARRTDRTIALHDRNDQLAEDAAAAAETVVQGSEPQALGLALGNLSADGTDPLLERISEQVDQARESLTRVAVSHHSRDVAKLARELRHAMTLAWNLGGYLRWDTREGRRAPGQREDAVEVHNEATDLLARFQTQVRHSRQNGL